MRMLVVCDPIPLVRPLLFLDVEHFRGGRVHREGDPLRKLTAQATEKKKLSITRGCIILTCGVAERW